MKWLTAVICILTLSGCNCDGSWLKRARDPKCDTVCYGGVSTYAGVGVCNNGVWKCDEDGAVVECAGWVAPQERACNKLDNDCDGMIDSYRARCSTVCGEGEQFCLLGVLQKCGAQEPKPETCNGVDDDCDGLVDEETDLPLAFCYTGATTELAAPFGDCSPGVNKCRFGINICIGEKKPTEDICGDGIDNDCDGIVDNGTNKPRPKDIVICIDESGSMGGIISSIQSTVRIWAMKYASRTDLRFALEVCPGNVPSEDNKVILRQDLTDATTFEQAVSNVSAGFTGYEPTIDAVYLTAEPANTLGISWTGADKLMVVFTDESPQTRSSTSPINESQAGMMAASVNMRVIMFVDPTMFWRFANMTTPNNGVLFNVFMSPQQMEDELDKFVNECN